VSATPLGPLLALALEISTRYSFFLPASHMENAAKMSIRLNQDDLIFILCGQDSPVTLHGDYIEIYLQIST
jgi:hypothetical protein